MILLLFHSFSSELVFQRSLDSFSYPTVFPFCSQIPSLSFASVSSLYVWIFILMFPVLLQQAVFSVFCVHFNFPPNHFVTCVFSPCCLVSIYCLSLPLSSVTCSLMAVSLLALCFPGKICSFEFLVLDLFLSCILWEFSIKVWVYSCLLRIHIQSFF